MPLMTIIRGVYTILMLETTKKSGAAVRCLNISKPNLFLDRWLRCV